MRIIDLTHKKKKKRRRKKLHNKMLLKLKVHQKKVKQ
jgi:hypothetical protein